MDDEAAPSLKGYRSKWRTLSHADSLTGEVHDLTDETDDVQSFSKPECSNMSGAVHDLTECGLDADLSLKPEPSDVAAVAFADVRFPDGLILTRTLNMSVVSGIQHQI